MNFSKVMNVKTELFYYKKILDALLELRELKNEVKKINLAKKLEILAKRSFHQEAKQFFETNTETIKGRSKKIIDV